MRPDRFLLLYTLFFLASPTWAKPAPAQKSIMVLTSSWEGYTNTDKTGLYFDILNEVYGESAYQFTLYPWKRAQSSFSKGQGDILLIEGFDKDYCLYPEGPLDADFFSAVHIQKKNPQWPGRAAAGSLRLGWVNGYDLNTYAPELKVTTEVNDIDQGIKMVLAGRLDFFIDYDQDLKDYINKNNLASKGALVSATDVAGDYLYLCFHKTESGKALRDVYQKRIKALQQTGALKAIFKKYNRLKNYDKINAFKASPKKP